MSMQENVLLANTPYGADLFFGHIDLPYVLVQLYTADGKLIKNSEENVNGEVIHLSMNEFATRIYVVRMLSGEKLWTGKFFWQQL